MNLDKELSVLLNAIQEAGQVILQLQQQGLQITKKANDDLLTQADLQADAILKKHLLGAFPTYGWLSEETADDAKRLGCDRVWIVDPIDGTKEFVQGIPEFAVSVALVEQGIPLLGAVFNPAQNRLFHAVKGAGAWHNQQKILCSHNSNVLLVSRSEYQRGEWNQFQSPYTMKEMGSIAYKLALVAAGEAAAVMTQQPRSEWDIAAGVLLVQEAQGDVTDKSNQAFVFNQQQVRVNGIIAKAKTNE